VRGPRLLLLATLAVSAMCIGIILSLPAGPIAAGALIRWTARTSLVFFTLAYVARPLVQLRPSPASKWLLAERKWLGLSFAVSHAWHFAGIAWLASPDVGAFIRAQSPTTAVAALVFVLLAAMAITSIEAVKRRMSKTAWRGLHWTGMQLAWVAFATTYAGAIGTSPIYALPAAIVLAVAGVRIAAWARARRKKLTARGRTSPAAHGS
jgi:DMSO/TMAO reductase YedYZ heme-binding membrane subunit